MLTERIINKAKRGNKKAFQELIELEKNKLFRMAYMYVKDENDALDIFQDTVCKAFLSIDKLKETQYFSTWITRILINSALDFIKRNERVIPLIDVESINSIQNLHIEEKMDLVEAIKRLPVDYRSVIILRFYKDLTIKQIAEVLESPEGTVKTHLHRALKQLKADLKKGCI